MMIGGTIQTQRSGTRLISLILLFGAFCFALPHSTYAQTEQKVRFIPGQFFQEPNCPVAVTQTRTELDVDPFDTPIDARVYLTYTNTSTSPISAANFRIRLTNEAGDNLGTFRGADSGYLAPGQERSQKFKQERIHGGVTAMQVRVMQVKFTTGEVWESFKLKEQKTDGGGGGQVDPPPIPQPPAGP